MNPNHSVHCIRSLNGTIRYSVVPLCGCFYGCHRSGELVLKGKKNIDWRKIIKRSSLHFSGGYAGYRLPYHKTDPFYKGTDILFSPQEVADPVVLLREFAQARDAIHGARRPLFLRPSVATPSELVGPPFMQPLASQNPSLWLWVAGPQKPGRFMSVITPAFAQPFSSLLCAVLHIDTLPQLLASSSHHLHPTSLLFSPHSPTLVASS